MSRLKQNRRHVAAYTYVVAAMMLVWPLVGIADGLLEKFCRNCIAKGQIEFSTWEMESPIGLDAGLKAGKLILECSRLADQEINHVDPEKSEGRLRVESDSGSKASAKGPTFFIQTSKALYSIGENSSEENCSHFQFTHPSSKAYPKRGANNLYTSSLNYLDLTMRDSISTAILLERGRAGSPWVVLTSHHHSYSSAGEGKKTATTSSYIYGDQKLFLCKQATSEGVRRWWDQIKKASHASCIEKMKASAGPDGTILILKSELGD